MHRLSYIFLFLVGAVQRTLILANDGSYNSFVKQIGYCKMQSFTTTSRNTSASVPMYMDGRISFGVGLSHKNAIESDLNLCGACMNITSIENFYSWDPQLVSYRYDPWPLDHFFLAMVFDDCEDPICTNDFLDFDIYSATQPVKLGNPRNIQWHFIPCPVRKDEFIEYLICTATTCKQQDIHSLTIPEIIHDPVHFWSITFRNFRIPIKNVSVHYHDTEYFLKRQNSWVWDYHIYDLQKGITMSFWDAEGHKYDDHINLRELGDRKNEAYHGGILVPSLLQN